MPGNPAQRKVPFPQTSVFYRQCEKFALKTNCTYKRRLPLFHVCLEKCGNNNKNDNAAKMLASDYN